MPQSRKEILFKIGTKCHSFPKHPKEDLELIQWISWTQRFNPTDPGPDLSLNRWRTKNGMRGTNARTRHAMRAVRMRAKMRAHNIHDVVSHVMCKNKMRRNNAMSLCARATHECKSVRAIKAQWMSRKKHAACAPQRQSARHKGAHNTTLRAARKMYETKRAQKYIHVWWCVVMHALQWKCHARVCVRVKRGTSP